MDLFRFDYQGHSHNFKTTPQGFLRVQARLSRSGIFHDNNSREYRADSEVFSHSALSSIKSAPVTNLHPAETSAEGMLSPDNVKDHIIGMAKSVERDGNFLTGSLIIFDKDAGSR